eukprot:TRINITY_DN4175_c3_g3_i2.p1 TRINITY_DN4175_c3_g3~~TRINITY_DN4175_c3_g3_i2.p1  ORF type:complete len:343 (+),score=51.25 TRINITY_DN4175_c3_g3_i2:64-1092(+)
MDVASAAPSSSQLAPVVAQDPAQASVPGTLGEYLLRPGVYWLFHHLRFFGYFYWLPPLLYARPRSTSLGLAMYMGVHRQEWWQKAMHRLLGYGASRRHRVVNEVSHLIKPDKRYLFSIHPHSILADGWHSVIARNLDSFAKESNGPPTIGRKIALCFAPIVQHVPVHQEMYRENCGSADLKYITRWWKESTDTDPALIPGGFAEVCIENGKDMVPLYTFGATRMYKQPPFLRGARARFSQHYYIGLVLHWGKLCSAMPLTDETTTVVFPPFEASRYTMDQLDEAHAAYLEHLKFHFDANKGKYGMGGVELVFVGKDWEDEDALAKALRTVGLMKSAKPRSRL